MIGSSTAMHLMHTNMPQWVMHCHRLPFAGLQSQMLGGHRHWHFLRPSTRIGWVVRAEVLQRRDLIERSFPSVMWESAASATFGCSRVESWSGMSSKPIPAAPAGATPVVGGGRVVGAAAGFVSNHGRRAVALGLGNSNGCKVGWSGSGGGAIGLVSRAQVVQR